MPAYLLTPPAAEPLTLAESKQFLRVEHGDDDALIAALIAGARGHVEAATRRALVTQTWRHVLDCWPRRGRLRVVPAPLQAVAAARVYASDGTTIAIAPSAFTIDRAADTLAFAATLPAPQRAAAGIEIDVTAGYGEATDVPAPLRQAMRLLIAQWYENRAVAGAGAPLPENVRALLAPYRGIGL